MKLVDDIRKLAHERETRAAFLAVGAFSAFLAATGFAIESKSYMATVAGALGAVFTAGAVGSVRDSRQFREAIDPETNELRLTLSNGPL